VCSSVGILPMCITGVPPVEAEPGWPCDSWALAPMLRSRAGTHDLRRELPRAPAPSYYGSCPSGLIRMTRMKAMTHRGVLGWHRQGPWP
jgi:hypothetical protein